MRRIPTKQIDGDVAVGRNIAAGGDANVQGSARVGHDLVVEGYLDAKNIKSPCKGLFKTAAMLKECFPRPHDGWWAMVGTSVPAYVYVAEGGEWVATGGVAPTKEGMDIYTQSLENEKGKAGGIAPLDASAKVPLANLPLRTVEVAVFHSIFHVGAILNITSGHKSTDDGYGVVYDPERKRFYLTATGQQNPNADVTLIQGYGYWADEDIFGAEPPEGYGREPVGFKLYRCATDGGLYYWDGTDLVDFNKRVNDRFDLVFDDINNLQNDVSNNAADIRANTDALTILNRRGQVESFAAVLTTDPDDDPIPAELVGKRVWSTQFNKFIEITATEEIDYKPPYRTPEDSAAVVDKFYRCGDRLFLGIKVSANATTLLPLFADTDSSTADGDKENLPHTWFVGMNLDTSEWSWQEADGTTGDLVDFREQVKPGDIIEISPADRFSVISCGEDYALCIIHNVYDRDGEAQRLFLRFDGTLSLEWLATDSGTTPSPDAGTITPEEIDALIDAGGDDELPADFEPFTTDELDAIING